MKKVIYSVLGTALLITLSFAPKVNQDLMEIQDPTIQEIIKSYKKAISEWPKPNIDYGVEWKEFESIKADTDYFKEQDKPNIILGKILFFDPKLSQSNQVSCSTCHDPEIGWSDKRRVSLGNEHLLGARNTPSLYKFHNN